MFKKLLLLLIIYCFSVINNLQGQYSGLALLGDKEKKVIPFEFDNGFIVLKIVYGGILYMNFILDTGASHNILLKKRANDLLDIPYTDTITISGADLGESYRALVSRNIPIKLHGTEVIQRDIIVLEEDYIDLENVIGRRIDGILGGDFFKGLVVSINFKKEKLTLYNPNSFIPDEDFTKHDIQLKNYKPYIKTTTRIEKYSDTLNYLLDTGASLTLLIHSNKNESFTLPKNTILGNLGKGLTGDITGYVGMTNNLQIGDYSFQNLVTSFQDIDSIYMAKNTIFRDGIVGTIILSRFHVIIDYVNEQLYLKPTSDLKREFEYDKSGLLIYGLGERHDQFIIKNVYPNTPASEAGLLPGDKIIKMGFWPIRFYNLEAIKDKLLEKSGKKIKMTVLRNGEKMKFKFVLRDLFKGKSN